MLRNLCWRYYVHQSHSSQLLDQYLILSIPKSAIFYNIFVISGYNIIIQIISAQFIEQSKQVVQLSPKLHFWAACRENNELLKNSKDEYQKRQNTVKTLHHCWGIWWMYQHLLKYCHGCYWWQDKLNATKCRVARMYIVLCVRGRWWCTDLQMCMYVYKQTYTRPHKVCSLPTTTILKHISYYGDAYNSSNPSIMVEYFHKRFYSAESY